MGLSNYMRYELTDHARLRYKQRINSSESIVDMSKKVRAYLSQSEFLAKENNDCESWFYPLKNYVIIINQSNFKVITIYSSLEEREEKKPIQQTLPAHKQPITNPKKLEAKEMVDRMISDFVNDVSIERNREHFKEILPLYVEFTDRLDKLTRTMKPKVFREKKKELYAIRSQFKDLEHEHSNLMLALKKFDLDGTV